MISPDESFHAKGVQSSMDYFQRFKFYKHFIFEHKDTVAMHSLIAELNAFIFGTVESLHITTISTSQDSSVAPPFDATVERLIRSTRAAATIYDSREG
jgi:hypothetical protein